MEIPKTKEIVRMYCPVTCQMPLVAMSAVIDASHMCNKRLHDLVDSTETAAKHWNEWHKLVERQTHSNNWLRMHGQRTRRKGANKGLWK